MSNIREYEAGFEEGKKVMKEGLIKEFLRDWRWGNVLKRHKWKIGFTLCKCPHHSEFWVWFEKKWEEKKVE